MKLLGSIVKLYPSVFNKCTMYAGKFLIRCRRGEGKTSIVQKNRGFMPTEKDKVYITMQLIYCQFGLWPSSPLINYKWHLVYVLNNEVITFMGFSYVVYLRLGAKDTYLWSPGCEHQGPKYYNRIAVSTRWWCRFSFSFKLHCWFCNPRRV